MSDGLSEAANVLHTLAQQRMVEALESTRNRHAIVLEGLSEAVVECDEDLRIRFVNRAWLALIGRDGSEIIGQTFLSCVHPDDRHLLDSARAHVTSLSGTESSSVHEHVEIRILRRDGVPVWCRAGLALGRFELEERWFVCLHDIQNARDLEQRQARTIRVFRLIERAQRSFIRTEDAELALEMILAGLRVFAEADDALILSLDVERPERSRCLAGAESPVGELSPEELLLARAVAATLPLDPKNFLAPSSMAPPLVAPNRSREVVVRILAMEPHDGGSHAIVSVLRAAPNRPLALGSDELIPFTIVLQQFVRSALLQEERRRSAAELELLSSVAQQTTNAVIITDLFGRITWVNRAFETSTGYGSDEAIGRTPGSLLQGPATDPETVETMRAARALHRGFEVEVVNYTKDRTPYWARIVCNVMQDPHGRTTGFLAVQTDITSERERTAQIEASDQEKAVLLQEIHHRVKNNLQIMSSMLKMQVRRVSSEEARESLLDGVRRTHAMALIHEQLYSSTTLGHVNMQGYLVRMVHSFRAISQSDARFAVEGDPVVLPVHTALTVGLIFSELVTNALKYGGTPASCPGYGRLGPDIDLLCEIYQSDHVIRCCMTDSGPGLPEDYDPAEGRGIGHTIIRALVGQLRGTLTYDVDRGTRFVFTFAHDTTVNPTALPLGSPSAPPTDVRPTRIP